MIQDEQDQSYYPVHHIDACCFWFDYYGKDVQGAVGVRNMSDRELVLILMTNSHSPHTKCTFRWACVA